MNDKISKLLDQVQREFPGKEIRIENVSEGDIHAIRNAHRARLQSLLERAVRGEPLQGDDATYALNLAIATLEDSARLAQLSQ